MYSDIHLLLREFLSNPIASHRFELFKVLLHFTTWPTFEYVAIFSIFQFWVHIWTGIFALWTMGRNASRKFSASITLPATMFRFLVHIIFHQNPTDNQSVLLLVKVDRLKPSDWRFNTPQTNPLKVLYLSDLHAGIGYNDGNDSISRFHLHTEWQCYFCADLA